MGLLFVPSQSSGRAKLLLAGLAFKFQPLAVLDSSMPREVKTFGKKLIAHFTFEGPLLSLNLGLALRLGSFLRFAQR